jgi:predicted ATPase
MIKEIYIDNYQCLVNFKIAPQKFQLWLGDNGTGKTSTMNALRSVQQTLNGGHVEDIYTEISLTKWDQRSAQTFSLHLEIDGEPYEYELIIEHTKQQHTCRIKRETLKWCGKAFFLFDGSEAHLYRINRRTKEVEEGTRFPADWRRSVISTIAERDDNAPLIRFCGEVKKWLIIQPVPCLVKQSAEVESKSLSGHAENFAQWYRHTLQENPGLGYKACKALADVLPGFEELSLKESGDSRKLSATFRINGRDRIFEFADLSDGQRQLIVLYTILESLKSNNYSVLLVDEPDNFVSLREIQPWLDALMDVCETESKQAVIISHHSEIINKMAHGDEIWFSRPQGAHVVTKPYPTTDGLTPAETMVRGWDNE